MIDRTPVGMWILTGLWGAVFVFLFVLWAGCSRVGDPTAPEELVWGEPAALRADLDAWLNFETDENPGLTMLTPEIAFQAPRFNRPEKRQSPLADYVPAEQHIVVGLQLSGFPDGVIVGGFGIEMQFTCDLGPGFCEGNPPLNYFRPGGDAGRLEYLGWTAVDLEAWRQHFDYEGQPFYLYGATPPETVWSYGDGYLTIRAAGICPVTSSTPTGTIPIDIGMGRVIMLLNFAVGAGSEGTVKFQIKDIGENEGWIDSDGSKGGATFLELVVDPIAADARRVRADAADAAVVGGCTVGGPGQVALPAITGKVGEYLEVPAMVWSSGRIDAYTFDLYYPPDRLKLLDIRRGNLVYDWPFHMFHEAATPGFVRFGGFGGSEYIAVDSHGQLAVLAFEVVGEGRGEFRVYQLLDHLESYASCNSWYRP